MALRFGAVAGLQVVVRVEPCDGRESSPEIQLSADAEKDFYPWTGRDDWRIDRPLQDRRALHGSAHRYCSSANGSRFDGMGPRNLWTSKLSCRCESYSGWAGYCRPLSNHTTSDLHRSMSLWLGGDRCAEVFGKRRAGNIVATGCTHANDM